MKKNNSKNFFQNKMFYGAVLTCASLMIILFATFSIGRSRINPAEDFVELEDLSSNMESTKTATIPPAAITQSTEGGEVQAFYSEVKETDFSTSAANETAVGSTTKNIKTELVKPENKKENEAGETIATAQPSTEMDSEQENAQAMEEEIVIFEQWPDSSEVALMWPLDGDIVMDFSADTAIYDVTLDQYRTNDSIRIAGSVGAQVMAAGNGVVASVLFDEEKGNVVVIDHGNGLKTTYGQLQDGILVKQGQDVKRGQVIGGVANPTKYGILVGGHLDFGVTVDDEPQDPKAVIAQAD